VKEDLKYLYRNLKKDLAAYRSAIKEDFLISILSLTPALIGFFSAYFAYQVLPSPTGKVVAIVIVTVGISLSLATAEWVIVKMVSMPEAGELEDTGGEGSEKGV